ncbi:MAG: hypothetical protein TYPL_2650 [Candidatus Tyloplasma litorale]|nr:MAG: hypothetical protein TYPL_2650 [Mycoplasmatales bacterium]
MNNKKLNLSKYAYLDYLKGDIFAWLNCNENFQKAAKKNKQLRDATPWRYEEETEEIEFSEILTSERYDIPDQIKAGNEVGEFAKIWAKTKFPNHKIFDLSNENINNNIKKVNEIINDNKIKNLIIFEAGFIFNDFKIKVDILLKTNNEFKVVEVKAVTYPKPIHGIDLLFQKIIIEKNNKKYKNWDYSLLILDSEYKNDLKLTDEEKSQKVLKNINYIGSSSTKPQRTIKFGEVKEKIKWSISQNHYFYRNLTIEEINIFNFDSNNKRIPRPAITFPIKDFFKTNYFNEIFLNFENDLKRIKEIQKLDIPPKLEFTKNNNDYMKSDYLKWAITEAGGYNCQYDSVFDVARLKFDIKAELFKSGIISIKDIPNNYLTPKKFNSDSSLDATKYVVDFYTKVSLGSKEISSYGKLIQKHAADSNESFMNKESLNKILSDYKKGPIYMYDFETANLAIPLTDYASPYEQVVYQYSIHIITNPNDYDFKTMKNIVHKEWLAENRNGFEKEVWKEFIKVFKEFGPGKYVAWNMSFEKGCLERAQKDFLTVEESLLLEKIKEQTIDLMIPFRDKFYYHKDLHGSYSIKYAGPHFVKELDYKKLKNVQKGDQSAGFAKAWLRREGRNPDKQWKRMRFDMLKYCEYDTLLMVAILQRLQEKLND